MFKLYTDRNENFECEVDVKNASLNGSFARLIVESNNLNLVFKGKIEGNKCVIPIRRLKGLLEENSTGKMHLEVIVEDTYFKPWKSEFIVEEHTSVKVRVTEQKSNSGKPMVEVKIPTKNVVKENINLTVPLKEISSICSIFDINKKNIKERKSEFIQILKEYFSSNPEYKNSKPIILKGIDRILK